LADCVYKIKSIAVLVRSHIFFVCFSFTAGKIEPSCGEFTMSLDNVHGVEKNPLWALSPKGKTVSIV